MARTVEQIEQDRVALERSAEAIAQDFEAAYRQYLTDLANAVRQQLIMASYHLCTQGYPERFLKISVSQRQKLQQSLRDLGQSAQEQFLSLLTPLPLQDPEPSEASEVPAAAPSAEIAPEVEIPQAAPPTAMDEEELSAAEISAAATSESTQTRELIDLVRVIQPETQTEKVLSTPEKLVRWQERVERGIADILQTLSQTANHLLHQADILPSHLPEPLLEAATKSGMSSEPTTGTPNLLNLMIESKSKSDEEIAVTRIIAIRLRLAEIEFNNILLTTWRSKLRGLSSRLNQLGRDYQKRQKELAIAQAEQAWRAVWFDE